MFTKHMQTTCASALMLCSKELVHSPSIFSFSSCRKDMLVGCSLKKILWFVFFPPGDLHICPVWVSGFVLSKLWASFLVEVQLPPVVVHVSAADGRPTHQPNSPSNSAFFTIIDYCLMLSWTAWNKQQFSLLGWWNVFTGRRKSLGNCSVKIVKSKNEDWIEWLSRR